MSVTDGGALATRLAFSKSSAMVPPVIVPENVKLPDDARLAALTLPLAVTVCALYIPNDMSLAIVIVDPCSLCLCLAPT